MEDPAMLYIENGEIISSSVYGPQGPRRKTTLEQWLRPCQARVKYLAMDGQVVDRFALRFKGQWHLCVAGEDAPRKALPVNRRDAAEMWLMHHKRR